MTVFHKSYWVWLRPGCMGIGIGIGAGMGWGQRCLSLFIIRAAAAKVFPFLTGASERASSSIGIPPLALWVPPHYFNLPTMDTYLYKKKTFQIICPVFRFRFSNLPSLFLYVVTGYPLSSSIFLPPHWRTISTYGKTRHENLHGMYRLGKVAYIGPAWSGVSALLGGHFFILSKKNFSAE